VTVYDTEDWFAFVRAVATAPDDDAPRLCAADWLDDRGEHDRAELIRLQCRLAVLEDESVGHDFDGFQAACKAGCPACAADEEIAALTAREARLLIAYDGCVRVPPGWLSVPATLDDEAEFPEPTVRFSRGFADAVRCPAADWIRHADGILARHPVAAVTLTTVPEVRLAGADGWRLDGRPKVRDRDLFREPGRSNRAVATALLTHYWPGIRFTLPPPPARDPDRVCTVSILDTVTGRLATDGGSTPYWWCEGNGSCDCNRLAFLGLRESAGGICAGATRCVIVAHDAPGYTLDDFNRDYPEELKAVARAWAATQSLPPRE
jgi:uncharacterized protein (TIGR02996 family)